MPGLKERKEQAQQHTELCVFRGKLAELCSGRETPSGTKRRAQSGEIMLIVCTRAGERHPKWREKREPCPELSVPCALLLLSTFFWSRQVGDQKGKKGSGEGTGAFKGEGGESGGQNAFGAGGGERAQLPWEASQWIQALVLNVFLHSVAYSPAPAPSLKGCMTLELPRHSGH